MWNIVVESLLFYFVCVWVCNSQVKSVTFIITTGVFFLFFSSKTCLCIKKSIDISLILLKIFVFNKIFDNVICTNIQRIATNSKYLFSIWYNSLDYKFVCDFNMVFVIENSHDGPNYKPFIFQDHSIFISQSFGEVAKMLGKSHMYVVVHVHFHMTPSPNKPHRHINFTGILYQNQLIIHS